LGKTSTGEHDEHTYGPGFYDAYKQVHAPIGDPGRITDPSQLYSMVGHSLTMAGVDKLVSEINGRKTPEGHAESAMLQEFFRLARPIITYENEELKIRDKKGGERFIDFMAAANAAYEAGKSGGKTPAQLLTSTSPDYIGKLIDNFKPSSAESVADRLADAEPPGILSRLQTGMSRLQTVFESPHGEPGSAAAVASPAKVPASINSLAELKAAYARMQIDPATARKIALERGWTRSRTPAPLDIDKTRLRIGPPLDHDAHSDWRVSP
jgi:hypothetical protein